MKKNYKDKEKKEGLMEENLDEKDLVTKADVDELYNEKTEEESEIEMIQRNNEGAK